MTPRVPSSFTRLTSAWRISEQAKAWLGGRRRDLSAISPEYDLWRQERKAPAIQHDGRARHHFQRSAAGKTRETLGAGTRVGDGENHLGKPGDSVVVRDVALLPHVFRRQVGQGLDAALRYGLRIVAL